MHTGIVHLLVYSAPSLQVQDCLGFAGEHLSDFYIFRYTCVVLFLLTIYVFGYLIFVVMGLI